MPSHHVVRIATQPAVVRMPRYAIFAKDPVLFLDYLVSLLPKDSFLREDGLGRWGCVVSLNLAMSYLAYRGLR